MIYLVCFIALLMLLILIIAYGKVVDINLILLIFLVAAANGGHLALAFSKNLEEAILANKLTYLTGIFAPMIVFLLVCNICRISLPRFLPALFYLFQTLLYLTVCTIGTSDIYYRTVEFRQGPSGAYLVKTYGPMHTVYLVTLILFTIVSLVAGLISLERKSVVSRTNVYILLFVDMMVVGIYLVERFVHFNVDMMPVVFTLAICIILIPLMKISIYSVYNNQYIFEDEMKKSGYILFNRKLRYMGCNDYAVSLFPELSGWELEKKVPGSGGRFNTFLRQPLLRYMEDEKNEALTGGAYEYKGGIYRYEIGPLYIFGKKVHGYIIRITNLTGVLGNETGKTQEMKVSS